MNEYLEGWADKSGDSEMSNPTGMEIEMFNLTHGIARKQIPKK